MPAGIIDGIGMDGMDIGIWAAGFMVTSWLDNERYGQYNRARSAGVSRFGISQRPEPLQTAMSAALASVSKVEPLCHASSDITLGSVFRNSPGADGTP